MLFVLSDNLNVTSVFSNRFTRTKRYERKHKGKARRYLFAVVLLKEQLSICIHLLFLTQMNKKHLFAAIEDEIIYFFVTDMLSPNSQKRFAYKDSHVLDILLQDDDDDDKLSTTSSGSMMSGLSDVIAKEADHMAANGAANSGRNIEAMDVDSCSVKPVGTPRARRSLALGQPSVAKASPLKRRRGISNSSDDDFQTSTRTPSKRVKIEKEEVPDRPTRTSVARTPSMRSVARTPSKTPSKTRTPSKRLANTPSRTPSRCETPTRKTRVQADKTETPKSSRKTAPKKKVPLQPLHKDQEAALKKRMESIRKKGAQRTRKSAVKEVIITSDGSGQIQTQEEVVSRRGRV